jgi:CheY-like chemotaxis protein
LRAGRKPFTDSDGLASAHGAAIVRESEQMQRSCDCQIDSADLRRTMNSPPRILIVEDQYFIAVDCELHLRTAGMECVGLASTAASALDLAERERPDLIIMDIHLASRVGGIEAAIVIYERLGIRCIFASAHIEELSDKDAERA